VPDLYVPEEQDHFALDSKVVLLVRASRGNKPVKQTYEVGPYQGETTRNAAEQHPYLVEFSQDGEYKRTVEAADQFEILRIGAFPSGTVLAFGMDKESHSPRLAILKEDGTILKPIEVSKDDTPASMVGGKNAAHASTVVPLQLVLEGRSIVIFQNQSGYPLLEVSEGGATRTIRAKLPKGENMKGLIPADRNLYVVAGPEAKEGKNEDSIYEVDPQDGAVLRRFTLGGGRTADSMACVHDGKFLSIDYGDGGVVPLTGSVKLATTVNSR
jgi:hypothetical protein